MSLSEGMVRSLEFNARYFVMSLGDLSDGELMQRPVPGANHANWQLGHLIVGEAEFMRKTGAAMPALPEGFAAKYTKETAASDDAQTFATKGELVKLFEQVRAATVAFARGLSDADLDKTTGVEMAPTVAEMLGFMNGHICMHWGQIQVLRRKLGKPVMF